MNSYSQEKPAANAAPLTFAVLVFPGFPMMAFSSVIEPLRAVNILAKRDCYRWVIVGADPGTVKASNGVVIQPGFSAADAPKADRIVVCSGGDADHVVADEAMSWIRKSLRGGAHIGAVADAAFFLARAGLLDGHACTLHWTSQAAFTEAFPDIELRRDLFVIDRKGRVRYRHVGAISVEDWNGKLQPLLARLRAES